MAAAAAGATGAVAAGAAASALAAKDDRGESGFADLERDKSHHAEKGGFRNPWPSAAKEGGNSFAGAFKLFAFTKSPEVPPPEQLPVLEPDMSKHLPSKDAPKDAIVTTWIGHSTFLISIDGFNVLLDPIFSDRCSAVQFAGPKRIVPPAMPLEDLPEIAACCISHNHYDHTDTNSIKKLVGKVSTWYVPLGMAAHLISCGVERDRVVELDWWQEHRLQPAGGGKQEQQQQQQQQQEKGEEKQKAGKGSGSLRVVCLPAQHFSGRGLTDRNATLWAGWAIVGPKKRLYFGGDTGLVTVPKGVETLEEERKLNLPRCPIYEQIGERLGPFDLSFIPIGAYTPRHFMSRVHLSPEDAVFVHQAVRSKQTIGCHWLTFNLSFEPLLEPPVRVDAEMRRLKLDTKKFITLKHGETAVLEDGADVERGEKQKQKK